MRKSLETVGGLLVLMGLSGTIDHLAYQPILGPFLNAFNRYVFPWFEALHGYEVYANLLVAVVGVVVIAAGRSVR
ncbi:hypothetical protein [Amycolatopsis albispora]|uniref:Uncharacterized protein n=1 Tax=Amycolatopsis albispora TaxID=1804986 RepID=A0A344LE48_9PSEU|nr:hypothetical protein [Amycolatopsis albispora]AXB46322.1 hypothetical protein A4R43_30890 [Amycolatopsis albispora]